MPSRSFRNFPPTLISSRILLCLSKMSNRYGAYNATLDEMQVDESESSVHQHPLSTDSIMERLPDHDPSIERLITGIARIMVTGNGIIERYAHRILAYRKWLISTCSGLLDLPEKKVWVKHVSTIRFSQPLGS